MKDKIDGPVLQQWAIDLLKSELKLSSYLNDPMCEREDLSAGIQNWNVKGEKVFFLLPLDRHTYKKKIPHGCVSFQSARKLSQFQPYQLTHLVNYLVPALL